MMSSCSLLLGMLLGSIIFSSFVAAQTKSDPYCQLPIDKKTVKFVLFSNLALYERSGYIFRIEDVHVERTNFTCLATRGYNRYSSATVLTEISVTNPWWSRYEPNSTVTYQFQIGCRNGKWDKATDTSTFDPAGSEQLFNLSLETQCNECTGSFAKQRPTYDLESNCDRKNFHQFLSDAVYIITACSSYIVDANDESVTFGN